MKNSNYVIKNKDNVKEVNVENITTSEEKQKLIIEYIIKFMKKDYYKTILFCMKWEKRDKVLFKAKEPEDIVMKILELFYIDNNKCYLKSYYTFKISVYKYVKWELLSLLRKEKRMESLNNIICEDDEVDYEDKKKYFEEGLYVDGVEELFKNIEQEEMQKSIFDCFDSNKDIEEIMVLEEILSGKSREEIANSLQITVDEVTNIKKRINRKISKNVSLANLLKA